MCAWKVENTERAVKGGFTEKLTFEKDLIEEGERKPCRYLSEEKSDYYYTIENSKCNILSAPGIF